MPWLETSPVEQRERFIADDRLGLYTRAELCARYGISRKTGYKWLARYHEDGRRGLKERSRAPHRCPHRIAPDIAGLLCKARRGIRNRSIRPWALIAAELWLTSARFMWLVAKSDRQR
ncbi:MAG TPA: leucine zipper domain-containing protein [Gemmatimonadota bacterium]|nr:leucine zipper domain-containing protein [Gemmatimonadota bacterium]